ncbi:rhodanese-like domain-containing protein [Octadecabacter ascidiaceicola]|uniref:Rhodanese-like domain protein n=1 Tax=Octadecabacter ascidiaceicola TaxID=1655543 RepID=A0A238KBX4_9RHOB|nr:rhodanese-like domain-containing protein [Octadecabacter ascidiaceicola]SMX40017.1 Rhodanese-like domain protein [Octadecabacter ascidiaceicola]
MIRTASVCTFMAIATASAAELLPVTADAVFTFNGQEFTISRASTIDQTTITALSQTSATCPSPCLSPMIVARNVPTLGELDVIDFLSNQVEAGEGLLIDARPPEERAIGFIPASVNIPAATLAPTNPYRDEILMALGAEQFQGVFNFSDVLSLVVFDAGPATQDASKLVTDLLAAGYPAEKIGYYRGGMLVWSTSGLSTESTIQ